MAWVLNDPPPRYGEELAECQRYQPFLSNNNGHGSPIGIGGAFSTKDAVIYIPTPVTIAKRPANTINFTGNLLLRRYNMANGAIYYSKVVAVTLNMASENTIAANMSVDENTTPLQVGELCEAYIIDGTLMPDCNI